MFRPSSCQISHSSTFERQLRRTSFGCPKSSTSGTDISKSHSETLERQLMQRTPHDGLSTNQTHLTKYFACRVQTSSANQPQWAPEQERNCFGKSNRQTPAELGSTQRTEVQPHVHTASANSQHQILSTRQTASQCAPSLACRATHVEVSSNVGEKRFGEDGRRGERTGEERRGGSGKMSRYFVFGREERIVRASPLPSPKKYNVIFPNCLDPSSVPSSSLLPNHTM